VDVTLRVSGLFRDAFETQIALFDSAVRAIAARDEASDWNPLAGASSRAETARVFGQAPGAYGAGLPEQLARDAFDDKDELGRAYLAASSAAYGLGLDGTDLPDAFAALVTKAAAFVHQQDHREMDLLEGATHAAHEGGFAAAAASLGASPALYHSDISRPGAPRTATIAEEIALVVRGRAANPVWIAGQMRHGYRGAAEIARAVEGLCAFAATLPTRLDRQFDLLFDATLGDTETCSFLLRENPAARADMQQRFEAARQRGLWRPRRNDIRPGDMP
jgi:cobaltochelatase CobN